MSVESEGTSNLPSSGPVSLPTLGKKRRIRGGYRAHTTKLCSESEVILETEDPSVFKIESLSVSLKSKLTLLEKIDDEIFNLIEDEDVEGEVIECEELKTDIQCIILKLDSKLRDIKSERDRETHQETSVYENFEKEINWLMDDTRYVYPGKVSVQFCPIIMRLVRKD